MNASREETIFNLARQLSRSQDRAAYLDDACGSDGFLRDRVERLLQAEQHADEFLANDPLDLRQASESTCSVSGSGALSISMPTVAPVPGDVIEDYEIIEKIGGNMGLVFKARHRLLDKVVALKLLPADCVSDPARLARFQRELRVMAQVEHPNLVTATDARVVDFWHLVAMELIDGMDLQRLVETQGALPVVAACEVARQAALALQYAHQHGLIHRDIKPSNLMLTHAGMIKVIDMGLAVIQEESTAQLTQTGLVLGTMRYCAPEQFRDASRVDIRADIYSLGCTLYHLLTGKPPYSERTTLAEVVQAHLHEPFPGLADALPNAPAELGAILARMTAKDPGARFATPGDVAEALAPFARGADLKSLLPARIPQPSARATSNGGKWQEARSPKPKQDAATAQASITADIVLGPMRTADIAVRPGGRRVAVAGKRRWKGATALLTVLLLAIAGAAVWATKYWQSDPIVVLMDTTATKGVYDTNNIGRGRFNADELVEVLKNDLPRGLVREPVVEYEWERDETIVALRPHLVVIHRSSFFHPLAAKWGWRYPPFGTKEELQEWEARYDIADDKLKRFMGTVARGVSRTHFLVYSRGTDKRWLDKAYREQWVKDIERRFPELRGKITPMVIPDGERSTFRHPETAAEIRGHVKAILSLPDKSD